LGSQRSHAPGRSSHAAPAAGIESPGRPAITRGSSSPAFARPAFGPEGAPSRASSRGAAGQASWNFANVPVHTAPQNADQAVAAIRHQDGQPLSESVRSHLEQFLGHDFSRVRVHTDERASAAAQGIHARAYTVGRHIGFAPGVYQPQTTSGRELIAHELVHTLQQGQRDVAGGDSAPLIPSRDATELEARRAARSGLPGAPQQRALGIACDDELLDLAQKARKAVADIDFFEMLDKIGTPQFNKAEVLRSVDHEDVEYIKRAVNLISSGRVLSDIAGSSQGKEVLEHMRDRLPPNSTERGKIEIELESRGTGPKGIKETVATAADTDAITKINNAVNADPHKAEYLKAVVPLRFPVRIYTPGKADDGGVYYDPTLSTAGQTPIEEFNLTVGAKTTRMQFPINFIKLGPTVLGFTDKFIQATLFHEFTHYTRVNEFRADEAGKSQETKLLQTEAETGGAAELDSLETDATSKEIAEFGPSLNDAEVKSNLLYLSRFLMAALPLIKTQAIDRIVASATANQQTRRLIKLIDGLKEKPKKDKLKLLRDALSDAAKAKPATPAPGPAKIAPTP